MKNEKKFDAVKMMREIRDKLSKEFMNISYDEQKRYIKEKLNPKVKTTQKDKKNAHRSLVKQVNINRNRGEGK